MKILQLGKFYPIRGGVEKVMYDLMLGLSAKGIHCDMLCAAYKRAPSRVINLNTSSIDDASASQATVYVERTWCVVAGTRIAPGMIGKLRKLLKENHYDIVHIHHPDPMAALALYLSGYKGKVILHWHSDILKQSFFLKFYCPLQNWLIKRADMVIGTSPVYLENSEHLKSRIDGKSQILPIGVNPIVPNPEGVETIKRRFPGKKIVFSLGRLVPYKGYKYLVDAAKLLPEDYVVVIGGTGPLKDSLTKQINSLGLQNKVHLLGYVADEDIPNWYGAADVFCLSSIQKTEAFAIVQIEAMSCGTPVVSCNIPGSGVPWVNSDGDSGLVVEPCDAAGLADAIQKITASESQMKFYSDNARRRYESMFEYGQMIEKCEKYYYLCAK